MFWMTIDPGETTGWGLWYEKALIHAAQHPRVEHIDIVDEFLSTELGLADYLNAEVWPDGPGVPDADYQLGALVCEEWQLYPDVLATGALDFDYCRTARAIGAYEFLARHHGVKMILQGAAIKKPAEAAGSRELYLTPQHENRHANDAIDHGVYYINRNGGPPC